ncbi:MAG: hypothetical protein KAQ79_16490 [Cyclobacteriaceae bacterium]|nr:hypothetical protein [Cyclobacteriaceae bacterium]
MDFITIGIGLLPVAYGIYILVLRLQGKNEKLKKLEPMKKFWGESLGLAIHFVAYIVAPIIIGVAIITAGVNGTSILQFFSN